MKKIIVTLLLILYLIPTSGINLSVHYCGGKISSIYFGTITTDKCACGSKKMKKNCCQDKNFSFQVDDEQIKATTSKLSFAKSFNLQIPFLHTFEFGYNPYFSITTTDYFHFHPNYIKQPLYILNQVFRI